MKFETNCFNGITQPWRRSVRTAMNGLFCCTEILKHANGNGVSLRGDTIAQSNRILPPGRHVCCYVHEVRGGDLSATRSAVGTARHLKNYKCSETSAESRADWRTAWRLGPWTCLPRTVRKPRASTQVTALTKSSMLYAACSGRTVERVVDVQSRPYIHD